MGEYGIDGFYPRWNNQVGTGQTNINYVSNGISYTQMSYYSSGDYTYLKYGDTVVCTHDADINTSTWTATVYQHIDFGSTPQTVSQEFYTWFTANAVKQL